EAGGVKRMSHRNADAPVQHRTQRAGAVQADKNVRAPCSANGARAFPAPCDGFGVMRTLLSEWRHWSRWDRSGGQECPHYLGASARGPFRSERWSMEGGSY